MLAFATGLRPLDRRHGERARWEHARDRGSVWPARSWSSWARARSGARWRGARARLGMEVTAVGAHAARRRRPSADRAGPTPARAPSPDADYVLDALPLRRGHRRLFDAAAFAAMQPRRVFVNVGRGRHGRRGGADRRAARGRIAGAALDVFDARAAAPDEPAVGHAERDRLAAHLRRRRRLGARRSSTSSSTTLRRCVARGAAAQPHRQARRASASAEPGCRRADRHSLTASVIDVRGLRKSYGDVEAVAGIDLHVDRGEVFALLGPNGAGKTTTDEILEGYRERTAGEVVGARPRPGSATSRR